MDNKDILNESISDITKDNFNTALITDNKICFVIGETLYRVRMPNQGEQSFAENRRNLIQLEYLKQPGCITQKQLIQQLKDSGVLDIKQLEENKNILLKKLKQYWFMLATKDSENASKIEEYTNFIVETQDALKEISLEIATVLSPSLESRLEKFFVEFVTNLCTEIKDGDTWKSVWKTMDEFNQADSELTNRAVANMTWLLMNRK